MPIATTTRTGTEVINAGEVIQKYWISRADFYADPNPLLNLANTPAIGIQGMPHVLINFWQPAVGPAVAGLTFSVWATSTTGNAGVAAWTLLLTDWVPVQPATIIPIGAATTLNLHLPGFAAIMVPIWAALVLPGPTCPAKDSLLYCVLGASAT